MRKNMYKAIIFDFDYTLGDATRGIVLSVNYALEQMNQEIKTTETIRKTIGLSLKETYMVLTGRKNDEEAEDFAKYFKQKADEVMVLNTDLLPPVKEVLAKLKEQNIRTGIVTTKFHYRIDRILEKFHMNTTMDIIVGAEDVKLEKPDPEGLLLAVKQLNITRRDVLYVGDSLVDAKTAENAGIDFAGVLTGTTDRSEFETYNPVYIAKDLAELYVCLPVK